MNSYYHMNTRVWARTDDISTCVACQCQWMGVTVVEQV